MDKIFSTILTMSLTSGYVILFVLIARILLKKAPKLFSYYLWGIVFFRLICPVSFESSMSLLPNYSKTDTAETTNLQFDSPANTNNKLFKEITQRESKHIENIPLTANTAKRAAASISQYIFLQLLWIIGILCISFHSILSTIQLKQKLKNAISINNKIYETSQIETPIVFGFLSPKIYIPPSLSKAEKEYILYHEQVHIKRFDYLVKPVAFGVLCIHWFNPFVWLSFSLMSKDMEMSCDEIVLKKLGKEIKKEYSSSLLSFATQKSIWNVTPLAFGENAIHSRIKNILHYKKPKFYILILAILTVFIASIALLSNPKSTQGKSDNQSFILPNTTAESSTDLSLENTEIPSTEPVKNETYSFSAHTKDIVEENLSILIKKPSTSSNLEDYIRQNEKVYETILKQGDEALSYLLSEFDSSKVQDDLKGQLMKRLCIELLGLRNNVEDTTLSPTEWYKQLSIRKVISLPDFSYDGTDQIEKLVYETALTQLSPFNEDSFAVVAPYIFAHYEEENKLKVFATIFVQSYILYDTILEQTSGSMVPTAITYVKNEDGTYTLEEYTPAGDGSYYPTSIREFCTLPISGKEISGLADTILSSSSYKQLQVLERENLIKHLKEHRQSGVSLYNGDYTYQELNASIPLT